MLGFWFYSENLLDTRRVFPAIICRHNDAAYRISNVGILWNIPTLRWEVEHWRDVISICDLNLNICRSANANGISNSYAQYVSVGNSFKI